MKSKITTLFLSTILLSLVLVSSADLISISKGPALSNSVTQTYFEIVSLSNTSISMPAKVLEISDSTGKKLILTLNPSTLNEASTASSRKRVNVTLTADSGFNYGLNILSFPVISVLAVDPANSSINETENIIFQFQPSFCTSGENYTSDYSLDITDVNIDNSDGDDDEWTPMDEITIKVDVENIGDKDLKDIIVELGLLDETGKNIVKNLNNLNNKKADLGNLDSDDEDTATFTFQVPEDFEAENYKLVIKAYSDDKGEKNVCIAHSSELNNNYYQAITGDRETEEEKQIIVANIIISPSPAQCSDKVQLTADITNIGDEDYEDQVKVTLYNKELGINLEQIIRKDFDQGDSETIDFEFDIPQSAKEKIYSLELRTYYDYDEDDNNYGIVSDRTFTKTITVQGNCQAEVISSKAQITAELDSTTPEAIAGQQLIINANIKNTGDKEATYTLSVSGNSAWSSVSSIEPQTITLAAGASKKVTFTLNVDAEAEGDKEFTIRATSGTQTSDQKVSVSITKRQLAGQNIINHIRNNWFIYVIVLVNLVLIIAIIAVIRSMFRSKRRSYD